MNNITIDDSSAEIPESIQIHRLRWQLLHRFWWVSHYLIGMICIVSGIIAADADDNGLLWGVIAATTAAFVTFLSPIQKAKQYHRAFHVIDQACLEFEVKKIGLHEMVEDVERARNISIGEDDKKRISN